MTERYEPNRTVLGHQMEPKIAKRTDGQPNPLAALDIRPAILTSSDRQQRSGWATVREGEEQPLGLTLDGRQAGLPAGTIEFQHNEESTDSTGIQFIRANGLTP